MSDPTKAIKGAGTTFWRLKDNQELQTPADYLNDDKWDKLGGVKELQPGEITVEDEEDNYLDDPNAEWTKTAPGQKSAGETNLTLDWKSGDPAQQKLIDDVDKGVVTEYRAKYPDGTVDAYSGYINSLGKAVTIKEKITRSVKFKNVGKPKLAEMLIAEQAAGAGA
ncbi:MULTISPECIES: phage tail tube protein [Vibrio]|uniref:phage tail tube protein n=1 Tax=Vibrio TaxID=662 RepID=UPI001BD6D7EA|nr:MULTISPECIES: phage tail tube protein [Vibrio]MBS9965053.1 phage tail protein [Vibrio alginolyticus]MDW1535887.1 phage tail tube protein [Vibrio sp. Y159]